MHSRKIKVTRGYSLDEQKVINKITTFLQNEFTTRGVQKAIIGISGGLDSSVTTYLTAKALDPKNVYGLLIPDESVTPKKDTKDGLKIAHTLGINYEIINVGESMSKIVQNFPGNKLARANFLVRLRMAILYYYASVNKGLVVGTADKSELQIGYFTKFGDGGADLFPIGDVYKTDVKKLALFLKIPKDILKKKSSARLWRGQTAEGEIGLSYEKIDAILKEKEKSNFEKRDPDYNIEGITGEDVEIVSKWINNTRHKHTSTPICKLNYKLFIKN